LDDYVATTGRKVFYEYIMIKGLTDRDWQAEALAELMRGRFAQVNFIPWNPGIATGRASMGRDTAIMPSEPATIAAFQDRLRAAGVPSTIRVTMGDDIAAACGQLATRQSGALAGIQPETPPID
jgi:23S rRNA (adenine2503-C2)-methyltransferase